MWRSANATVHAAQNITVTAKDNATCHAFFDFGTTWYDSTGSAGNTSVRRRDRDLPFIVVLGSLAVILATLILVPGILGLLESLWVKTVAALLIAVYLADVVETVSLLKLSEQPCDELAAIFVITFNERLAFFKSKAE